MSCDKSFLTVSTFSIMQINRSIKHQDYKIEAYCWWGINIILVFTFLLKPITILSNLALLGLILCNYKKLEPGQKKYIVAILVITLILASYSLILQNKIPNIIRFSIIVYFICVSYLIKLPIKILLSPLRVTGLLLAVLIICIELYMMFLFDTSQLSTLRFYLTSNGLGDIYPKYGAIYAIQLVGTAALPFIFMLSYVEESLFTYHKRICRTLILIGIIFAGNFGFLVAIFIFFILITGLKFIRKKLNYKEWLKYSILLFSIFIITCPFIYKFTISTLEEKKQESNAIRVDQAEVLINDISDNFGTLLLGNGLGHTLKIKTQYRDYTDNTYFELQLLYFFNQLGLIPFVAFIILNVYLSCKYICERKYLIVYLSYLIYAATNPYILNTNQIVVIISLVSLNHSLIENYDKRVQLKAIR